MAKKPRWFKWSGWSRKANAVGVVKHFISEGRRAKLIPADPNALMPSWGVAVWGTEDGC